MKPGDKVICMKYDCNNINVDDVIFDKIDDSECRVVEKTTNSIRVFMTRKSKKGIDCYQWFDLERFNNRFYK